jgi:NitT/TauT family transport system permease protein
MSAILLSFAIGSAAGVLIGFLLVTFPKAERVLDFYLTLVNSFPRVALAPLFIALFGLGQTAKIVTTVTVIVFIVIAGTVAGAKTVDADLSMLFKAVGARRGTIFLKLILPSSVPSIFSALKLSLVYSSLAVVVTEMIGSNSGIGYRVNYLSNTFRMDGVIALLMLLAVITVCLAGIMNIIERRLTRWR